MTPVPVGDESLPRYLTADPSGNFTAPVMLVTGEINGHGGAFFLMPAMNAGAAGQVDLVQSSGAGGVSLLDIKDLTSAGVAVANRFAVPVYLVNTRAIGADEYGAAAPGSVAIGHSEGVTVSGNYLYLADGPHGMSVWKIADGVGLPVDDLHLVANTLMDEYPVNGILPAPMRSASRSGAIRPRPLCCPRASACVASTFRPSPAARPPSDRPHCSMCWRAGSTSTARGQWPCRRRRRPGPRLWRDLPRQLRHRGGRRQRAHGVRHHRGRDHGQPRGGQPRRRVEGQADAGPHPVREALDRRGHRQDLRRGVRRPVRSHRGRHDRAARQQPSDPA